MTTLTTYVALLRGINVGGRKPVAMAPLSDLLTALGFVDVRSLLQSGNLVFRSDVLRSAEVERRLTAALLECFGLQTDVMVRTAAEWGGRSWRAIPSARKPSGTRAICS